MSLFIDHIVCIFDVGSNKDFNESNNVSSYPELALIGTSALAGYDIDGAVGMYSGVFNNPFMIWGRYRKRWFRTYLTVSFQFHHTQMDGAHAARFLDLLQAEIQRCGQTE